MLFVLALPFIAQGDDAEGAASYWRGSRVRQAEELNLPAPLIDIAPCPHAVVNLHMVQIGFKMA